MAISGVSSNGLNFTGLATGIDTQKIIDGLNAINQQRIDRLNTQKADIAAKQTTFVSLQAKLFDLQFKTNALARSAGGAFDGRTAATSDATAATAVAGTAAVPGTYSVNVTSLARAAQVSSAGFADPNAALKTGTLKVTVGSGAATTIAVGAQNNTLQGIADGINAGAGDVRATVVVDSATSESKLLLTATKTGSANAITVDATGLTGGTGADLFAGGVPAVVQAAADARVTLGSGPGALTIASPTNQVNSAIAGVTLNLLKEGQAVTVTVSADTAATVSAVQDFVTSYNAVKTFIAEQTRFSADTGTAGALIGNSDINNIADELASALSASVPGLTGGANRLSAAGLSFDNAGKLVLDSNKLTAALNDPTGAAATNFKKLFSLSGTSDTTGVNFLIGGSKTKPTVGGSPVQVNVTAPARQAVVVASGAPGAVTLTPPDNQLQFKLNSLMTSNVSLPAGTYPDVASLIAAVQRAINAAQASSDNFVSVSLNGDGKVQIATQRFGASASFALTGGSAAVLGALGFSGTESATGTNVAGSFVVNGATESATGNGQVLSGNSGNATTDGLQVTSALSAPGSANVTVTQGIASRLSAVLGNYLDPAVGRFKTINDGFNQRTEALDKTIAKQQTILDSKTAELQQRFAAMETAVNNLKGLQTQLSSLTVTANSNK